MPSPPETIVKQLAVKYHSGAFVDVRPDAVFIDGVFSYEHLRELAYYLLCARNQSTHTEWERLCGERDRS